MSQLDRVKPAPPGVARPTSLSGRTAVRGLDEYALACRRSGQRLLRCGTTWWREVRPCFFRPFLPFLDVPSGSAGLPWRSALGGCQYPSGEGGPPPNSLLPYLAFEDAQGYSIQHLSPRLRRYVRAAERRYVIKPLMHSAEFKELAHPVYLEFHERTGYGYLDNRVRKPLFERWVDAEFADSGLVALGAWAGDSLVATGLSRVVGDAWVYSTFFATNDALHGHVANLMLHHVRTLASSVEGVATVYTGMQKFGAGASVDAFYERRGAVMVRRPAVLRINPLAGWMLRLLKPDTWRRLRGDSDAGARTPPPGDRMDGDGSGDDR